MTTPLIMVVTSEVDYETARGLLPVTSAVFLIPTKYTLTETNQNDNCYRWFNYIKSSTANVLFRTETQSQHLQFQCAARIVRRVAAHAAIAQPNSFLITYTAVLFGVRCTIGLPSAVPCVWVLQIVLSWLAVHGAADRECRCWQLNSK
jgi:hypothetical protein